MLNVIHNNWLKKIESLGMEYGSIIKNKYGYKMENWQPHWSCEGNHKCWYMKGNNNLKVEISCLIWEIYINLLNEGDPFLVENKCQYVDIIMFDAWILIAFWIILWLHH